MRSTLRWPGAGSILNRSIENKVRESLGIALLPAALEAAPATKPAKAEKGEKEDK